MALGPTSGREKQARYKTGQVRYDEAQAINAAQQLRARQNIGAPDTALVTTTAPGLARPNDKTAHDRLVAPTIDELNAGAGTTPRGWTAAQLWSWLSGKIKGLLNATGNAPIYAARAWVTFSSNGQILQGRNVSSVTRLAEGRWRVNFTTAMPFAGYVVAGTATQNSGGNSSPRTVLVEEGTRLVGSVIVQCRYSTSGSQGLADPEHMHVVIFA